MKIFIALFLSLFVLNPAWSKSDIKTFPAVKIKKIKISSPKGKIIVSTLSSTEKIIKTTFEKIKYDEKCQESRTIVGETLEVKVESSNKIFNTYHCESKLTIEVPPGVYFELDVSTGSAEVIIEKISGNMDLLTSTGNISINAQVLRNLKIKSATGNVVAAYKKCEGRSDVSFVSATGDMALNLPDQCKIRVAHTSATGDLFNELGESQDYLVLINSTTAGGKLTIKKNGL